MTESKCQYVLVSGLVSGPGPLVILDGVGYSKGNNIQAFSDFPSIICITLIVDASIDEAIYLGYYNLPWGVVGGLASTKRPTAETVGSNKLTDRVIFHGRQSIHNESAVHLCGFLKARPGLYFLSRSTP